MEVFIKRNNSRESEGVSACNAATEVISCLLLGFTKQGRPSALVPANRTE
jgi:hypothetical protein